MNQNYVSGILARLEGLALLWLAATLLVPLAVVGEIGGLDRWGVPALVWLFVYSASWLSKRFSAASPRPLNTKSMIGHTPRL